MTRLVLVHPNVKILNSFRRDSAKWDEWYLEFSADQSTIDRILANGFEPIAAKEMPEILGQVPSWWTPNLGPDAKIYATGVHDPDFRKLYFEHRLLIYEPQGKKVYYRYRR